MTAAQQKTIFTAASEGDIATINHLLSTGIKVEHKDTNGMTMVHYAAMNNQLKTLEFLKNNAANFSATTPEGNNAIHLAAVQGHRLVIEFLIENQVPARDRNREKDTPLHLVARHGHHQLLSLLYYGYFINTVNAKNYSALCEAIKGNHIECVKTLLDLTFISLASEKERLFFTELAINESSTEINKLLLDRRFFSSKKFRDECYIAVKKGDLNRVLFLFSYKETYPDAHRMLPMAAELGEQSIVLRLLKEKANINCTYGNETALIWAVQNGHSEVVESLLNAGACPTHWALYHAVNAENIDIVKLLLKKMPVNQNDANYLANLTLNLHTAIRAKNVELVQLLLDHKADPASYYEGHTGYDLAKDDACKKILKYHVSDVKHVAKFIYQMPVDVAFVNLVSGVHSLDEWKAKLADHPDSGSVLYELINNLTVSRNEKAVELIAKHGKEAVLSYIKNAPMPQKAALVKEALTPGTALNNFFNVQRGVLKPSPSRGCLGQLNTLNNQLNPDSTVPQSSLLATMCCGFFSPTTVNKPEADGSKSVPFVMR